MTDFDVAYEAWDRSFQELEELSGDEVARLNSLEEACGQVCKVGWWNTYKNIGTNQRGPHIGVHFGYKVEDGIEPDLSEEIQRLVEEFGFNFEKGEVTFWE